MNPEVAEEVQRALASNSLEVIPIMQGVSVIHPESVPPVFAGERFAFDIESVTRQIMQFHSARGVLIDGSTLPGCSFQQLPTILRQRGFPGKIGFIAAPFPGLPCQHTREGWWYRYCRSYEDLHAFVHNHLAADGLALRSLVDAQRFLTLLRTGNAWQRAFLHEWNEVGFGSDGTPLMWWNRLPHHELFAGVFGFDVRHHSSYQLPATRFLESLFF